MHGGNPEASGSGAPAYRGASPAAACVLETEHEPGVYADWQLRSREIRTWRVAVLALATMGAEVVVGIVSGSLSLTADGWHMGAHAGAFAVAALAYWYARQALGRSPASAARVCAGAGAANAVALALVATFMLAEAVARLLEPVPVHHAQALPVAALGLLVNVISLRVLDVHEHEHHDHNIRGAHLHVVSDLVTSVVALVALAAGCLTGALWPDPAGALAGGGIILLWAVRLGCDSFRALQRPTP
jgi:cation diffusion facilitator family transporter